MNPPSHPNYVTQCADDVPSHLAAADADIAIQEYWSAHAHYLRCSGLSYDKADKRRYEAMASGMRKPAVAKMLRRDFEAAAALSEQAAAGMPGDPTVGELLDAWRPRLGGLSARDRLAFETFFNAANRIRDAEWGMAHRTYLEAIERDPSSTMPVVRQFEAVRTSEVVAWLRTDPLVTIPDLGEMS